MMNVSLTLGGRARSGTLSPNLFGHFIEFMHDCIDPGLYAQLLLSPGFEGVASENGLPAPWLEEGSKDRCAVDTEPVMTAGQSLRLRLSPDHWVGVGQDGLLLQGGDGYEGVLYALSQEPCELLVTVTDQGEALLHRRFDCQPGQWTRLDYRLEAGNRCDNARFSVRARGKGNLWLDQLSLKPLNRDCNCWPEVMRRIDALNIGMLRFPGGCFADCYHWWDGVGPAQLRPTRENRHWGGMELNHFGTDEFMALCGRIGCEPVICVNFGEGDAQEAAAWVEYCNGAPDSPMGALRAANGHPEPYGVRWWDIGNESFADWEIGHCGPKEYAERYLRFAEAMRAKDPSIRLIACGGDGNSFDQDWNQTVLPLIRGHADVLGLHIYSPMIAGEPVDEKPLYEAVTRGAPVKLQRLLDACRDTFRRIGWELPLAITEWNASYHNQSEREQTLEAALSNAGMMNVFLRVEPKLAFCLVSDLVNGWAGGLIRSKRGLAYGTATYHAVRMYASRRPRIAVEVQTDSPCADTPAVGNVPAAQAVPYVDAAAALDDQGRTVLFLVNRHPTEPAGIKLPEGQKAQAGELLCGEAPTARNLPGWETLVPQPLDCAAGLVLPPMSIATVLLQEG